MEYLFERWMKDEEARMKRVVKKRRISYFLISVLSAVLICIGIMLIEWISTLDLMGSLKEAVEFFGGCFVLCILLTLGHKDTVSGRMRYLKATLEKDFTNSEQLECLISEMERVPLFEMEDPCTKEIFILTPHYMMKTGRHYMITKADDIADIKYLKIGSSHSQHMKYIIECKDSDGKIIGYYRFSLSNVFETVCHAVSKFRGEEQVLWEKA